MPKQSLQLALGPVAGRLTWYSTFSSVSHSAVQPSGHLQLGRTYTVRGCIVMITSGQVGAPGSAGKRFCLIAISAWVGLQVATRMLTQGDHTWQCKLTWFVVQSPPHPPLLRRVCAPLLPTVLPAINEPSSRPSHHHALLLSSLVCPSRVCTNLCIARCPCDSSSESTLADF